MQFGLVMLEREVMAALKGRKCMKKRKKVDNHRFLKTVGLLHPSHGRYTGHSKLPPQAAALSHFAQNGVAWAFAELKALGLKVWWKSML